MQFLDKLLEEFQEYDGVNLQTHWGTSVGVFRELIAKTPKMCLRKSMHIFSVAITLGIPGGTPGVSFRETTGEITGIISVGMFGVCSENIPG